MTIIAALHESGVGTWIASDTQVSGGNAVIGYKRKWILAEGCALAVCGSNAALDLLAEHQSEIQANWSATAFFRWAKPLLDAHGFKPDAKEGGTPWYDCSFLLATPSGCLSIDSGGGGVPFGHNQFASRGSGADYADGAAWALTRAGKTPRDVLTEAVQAAIAFDGNCGGEVWVHCLKE